MVQNARYTTAHDKFLKEKKRKGNTVKLFKLTTDLNAILNDSAIESWHRSHLENMRKNPKEQSSKMGRYLKIMELK